MQQRTVDGVEKHLITVYTGVSEWAVRSVQELMADKPSTIDPHKRHVGALRGVAWREVILNGEAHTLTVEGKLDGKVTVLVVHAMGAGFWGTGSLNAVTVLTTLGIGTRDFLRGIVTTPDKTLPEGDEWKTVYSTLDLMPHGPQR